MAKIHALPGVSKPEAPLDAQPVEGIIEDLEELLAAARAGKLRAYAAALVWQNDETTTRWCRPPNGACGHAITASIGDLFYRNHQNRHEYSHAGGPSDEPA